MKVLITTILFFHLIVSTMGMAQESDNKANAETAIRAIIADLADAWSAGDAEAWSEHLAEDVDFTVWTGMYIKGRDGVTTGHKRIFATVYKDTKQKLEVRSIRFLRSDVAAVHVDGAVVKKGDDFPEKPAVAPLLIFTKQNSEWQIAVFQNLLYLETARKQICNDQSR